MRRAKPSSAHTALDETCIASKTERARVSRRRLTHPVVTSLLTALLLSGCSNSNSTYDPNLGRAAFTEKEYGVSSSPRLVQNLGPVPKGGGRRKLGAPYRVAGKLYVPREDRNYEASGRASWYGFDFHGRKTANGEVFDSRALSAAHPTMPLPSYAYVTNLENNRTILVRVNDRGPYVGDRIIDMSQASADALGYRHKGTARVRVRYAGPAPLSGQDHHERRFLAEQPWSGSSAPRAALGGPRLTRQPERVSRADGMWSHSDYRASVAARNR